MSAQSTEATTQYLLSVRLSSSVFSLDETERFFYGLLDRVHESFGRRGRPGYSNRELNSQGEAVYQAVIRGPESRHETIAVISKALRWDEEQRSYRPLLGVSWVLDEFDERSLSVVPSESDQYTSNDMVEGPRGLGFMLFG